MFSSQLIQVLIHFHDVLIEIYVVDDEIYHEAIIIKTKKNISIIIDLKLTIGLFHNTFVFEHRSSKYKFQ